MLLKERACYLQYRSPYPNLVTNISTYSSISFIYFLQIYFIQLFPRFLLVSCIFFMHILAFLCFFHCYQFFCVFFLIKLVNPTKWSAEDLPPIVSFALLHHRRHWKLWWAVSLPFVQPLFRTLCLIATNKSKQRGDGEKRHEAQETERQEEREQKERQQETKRLNPQLIPWYYSCQSCIYFLSIWHMLLWLLNMPGHILCCTSLFFFLGLVNEIT